MVRQFSSVLSCDMQGMMLTQLWDLLMHGWKYVVKRSSSSTTGVVTDL